jgi:hypothetical protein
MNISCSDRFRSSIVNAKAYVGHFSGLTRELGDLISKHCARFQYVLWEQPYTNPNTLQKSLVLKVTYYKQRSPYAGPMFITQDIGIDELGRFMILFEQQLPGDRAPWFYPMIHMPTFPRLVDLLVYLEYKPNFAAYNMRMLQEIQNAKKKYKHYNKYNCCNHCANCKLGKTKTVRSLKNLTSCFIQSYSVKVAFKPALLEKLKGVELPVDVYEYLECCNNYIYDDGKLDTIPKTLCSIN